MVKVMIAEDNTELCKSCFEFLTNDEEIKVISCAEDGEETLKKYLEIQPDVLLLDLNLPKMSGIDVINKLDSNLEERKKCNIVVFSGNFEYMHQLYNTAKIYRVLPKPVNFDYILKTIKEVPIKEKEINQKELKKLLVELRLNIYKSNVKNLITAINIAYKKPFLLNTMNELYSEVSKETGISPTTIKWSIRNAIGTLSRSMSIEDLCSIFNLKITVDSLTSKHFITLVVEYFEQE